jgi:hypothetical protein
MSLEREEEEEKQKWNMIRAISRKTRLSITFSPKVLQHSKRLNY